MAMLLGVAVFGFSYQMRPIDAKNGNVIPNFGSLYYVNLGIRMPSENLTPQISPSALSFLYQWKEEILSYIPRFEFACGRTSLLIHFVFKIKLF